MEDNVGSNNPWLFDTIQGSTSHESLHPPALRLSEKWSRNVIDYVEPAGKANEKVFAYVHVPSSARSVSSVFMYL